ncbi:FAD:protein FMN transferase [Catenulispora subtropica]|uniref:FAD:protein FMN transferase n=1 Tax=Catenulispora subtropica TaxID=450798 RepID=A0ABP5E238_9ACTN
MLAAELAAIDTACSRFRPDSEVSRVNSAQGAAVSVSPLFLEFLGVALRAAEVTAGAVDPTCGSALLALGYDRDFAEIRKAGPGRHRAESPGSCPDPVPVPGWQSVEVDPGHRRIRIPRGVRLDFGATAKAHAADRAARRLAAELGCGVLVNLSGDLSVAGPAPDGGWPVRAADGERTDADAPGQTIVLHDGGAATSGTTVRTWLHDGRAVHHIVDPVTGDTAAVHWHTVSAVAGTCVDANILTTAALVRGPALLPFLHGTGCPMRLLGPDGRITLLGGWPEEDRLQ